MSAAKARRPRSRPETTCARIESYIGYAQARLHVAGRNVWQDAPKICDARRARVLPLNRLESGRCPGPSAANSPRRTTHPAADIKFRFHARDLHLVWAQVSKERPIRFSHQDRDGLAAWPQPTASDVDAGRIEDAVRAGPSLGRAAKPEPIADRTFEIEFFRPALRLVCVHVRIKRNSPGNHLNRSPNGGDFHERHRRHRTSRRQLPADNRFPAQQAFTATGLGIDRRCACAIRQQQSDQARRDQAGGSLTLRSAP